MRRLPIAAATVLLLAVGLARGGPPETTTPHVGVLTASSRPSIVDAFTSRLRERGYTDGGDVIVEWRFHEQRPERLLEFAADLVRRRVTVLVASSVQGIYAAKGAAPTIPTIMLGLSDPVGSGLVASLARPGGNVTGCATAIPSGLLVRQAKIFKEIMPDASRLAILVNPANAVHADTIQREMPAVVSLMGGGGDVHRVDVREFDLASAVEAAVQAQADGLIVLDDLFFFAERVQIADLGARWRIPTIYPWRAAVELGGLMSYGPSDVAAWRCAADYTAKVLKGTRPAELSVEEVTALEMAIHLGAASRLGLTIPSSLSRRADALIQ